MFYDFELAEELGEEIGIAMVKVINNIKDFYDRCFNKNN